MSVMMLRAPNGWSTPTPSLPSLGASCMAGIAAKARRIGLQALARSALGERRLTTPLSQLREGFEESKTLAASGEYAIPSTAALREAAELIESMPAWAPIPTPLMEPSGAIALEWDFGPGRFFVLAVDGTRRLEYSAIFGLGDERYGVINLSDAMPVPAQKLLAEMIQG